MESTGSRKVKYRWDSVHDVSPNKCIKYSGVPEPDFTTGPFQNGQDRTYQSEDVILKRLGEKPGTLDSSDAFNQIKSEMESEHCAFPRGSAHSTAHHSVNAKPWRVKRTLTPLRKTLFPNQRCHSLPVEVAHAPSEPSISEVKHGNVQCVNMDSSNSRLPEVVGKESLQESSSLERRRTIRSRSDQGCPGLFKRALQDAIGNSYTSRVKTASILGKDCVPHQSIELSQPVSSRSRSFSYFSSGDRQEHETSQGGSSQLLTRNVPVSRTAGEECQPTNFYSCPSSEDSLLNMESDIESQVGNLLYSKSDTDTSRKSRLNNTAVLGPRPSRHSDPAGYRISKENRHIDHASEKIKNRSNAVYPASRGGVYSNVRESTLSDTADMTSSSSNRVPVCVTSSNNRDTVTALYSTARKSLHNSIDIRALRNNSHNDTDVCLSNENVCRSSIGLPSALDTMHSDTTVYPNSGLGDSVHFNSTALRTSKVNLYSDTKVYPTTSDRRHSDPNGYPSCKVSCPSNMGDSRPNNTEMYRSSWESNYNDTTLHLTSVDISCGDAVLCPPSKEIRPNDAAIYPQSRDRPRSTPEICQTSKEILHTKLETHKVPIDNHSTRVTQQEQVCVRRVDNHEEAPRLVFLHEHDSDDDESKSNADERDLSVGSDFSDVDDVIPFAKLSQDEFIQATNSLGKESITPVMYPLPLYPSSWSDYTCYGTSTPLNGSLTARSVLYNSITNKNGTSRNLSLNTSISSNYSALSDGWCCGLNSFSDSLISQDNSRTFTEEPDLLKTLNGEAHSPDHDIHQSEWQDLPAKPPRWMYDGFIDTHCHLDMLYTKLTYKGTFAKFRQVYSSTFSNQFQGCIADFCNPRVTKKFPWEDMLREDMVWGAFGCHPHFARFYNDFHERELLQAMRHPKTIAFGEMGLDYSHKCSTEIAVQHKVFERQLQLAVGLRKPLVIHCRDADEDVLKIMKKAVPRDYKIHRHCFTGSYSVIEPFLEAFPNMAVGFTAVVTYPSASEAREAVSKIPLERIIVETDAPYFLPRQVHKRESQYAHPGLAIHTVNEIARIKELPPTSVLAVLRQNTNQLYSL
ncbi:3'-5' RNA nuclease TATDN2 [Lissotriton helveticus]